MSSSTAATTAATSASTSASTSTPSPSLTTSTPPPASAIASASLSMSSYNTRGVWSEAEHDRFLKAMQLFPNGPWRAVAEHVGTRSVRQVQTHAQKYHEKVARRLRGLRKDRKRLQRPEHRIDDEMLEICKALQQDPASGVQKPKTPPSSEHGSTPYHRRSRSMMEWKDLKQVQATLVATERSAELDELTEVEQEDSLGPNAMPTFGSGFGSGFGPGFGSGLGSVPPLNDCLDFLIDVFNEPPRSMPVPRYSESESVELNDPEVDLDHLQLATTTARPRMPRKTSM